MDVVSRLDRRYDERPSHRIGRPVTNEPLSVDVSVGDTFACTDYN
jgi:hypothetical protein